jgi:hypothetical protein
MSKEQINSATASVIVYGPQMSGKTYNSEAIAKAMGLKKIVDGWGFTDRDNKFNPWDTLYLTDTKPSERFKSMHINEALKLIGKEPWTGGK